MSISNHQKNQIFITITTSFVLGAWTLPAYAYLDPGTGSMLIQSIIGAVAAVGITLKIYWHKIKLMISGRKPQGETIGMSQDTASKK